MCDNVKIRSIKIVKASIKSINISEFEFLEEESEMVGLIGRVLGDGKSSIFISHSGSQSLNHFFSFFSVLSVSFFFSHNVFEINFTTDHVSGRHNMVVIYIFDKRLNSGSLLDFILAHSLGNSTGISFNTGD